MNNQLAPSSSHIRVLVTLTMSSFAPETREECTGYVNPWFLQQWRARDQRTSRWLSFSSTLQKSAHVFRLFSGFWTSGIEIETCCTAIPSKNRSSLYSATILNHSITCLHTSVFLEARQSRLGPGKG